MKITRKITRELGGNGKKMGKIGGEIEGLLPNTECCKAAALSLTSKGSSEEREDCSWSQRNVFTGSQKCIYETPHEGCIQSILESSREEGMKEDI